eukprot:5424164-Prymnesium_polylepis.1
MHRFRPQDRQSEPILSRGACASLTDGNPTYAPVDWTDSQSTMATRLPRKFDTAPARMRSKRE